MQELTEIFLVFFPANAGEVLTEAEQDALDEYRAEVAAFAEQRLLGNKAFMKKLITTEPSVAPMTNTKAPPERSRRGMPPTVQI